MSICSVIIVNNSLFLSGHNPYNHWAHYHRILIGAILASAYIIMYHMPLHFDIMPLFQGETVSDQ